MPDPALAAAGANLEAEHQIQTIRKRRPGVVVLATLASAAAVVEPSLLRNLRLQLLPWINVGVESELWFSALVEHTSARGMMFRLPAAEVLRRSLAEWPDRQQVRDIVEKHHASQSDFIRLEESLIWESVRGGDPTPLLSQVRATIDDSPDKALDVLRWYRQAVRRIPLEASGSALGRELFDLARLNLERRVPQSVLDADSFPRGSGHLFSVAIPEVPTRVVFADDLLTLSPAELGTLSTVPVPDTVPPVVEVQWVTPGGDPRSRIVSVDRDARVGLPPGTKAVTLRMLTGTRYRVAAPPRSGPRRAFVSATMELRDPTDGSFVAAAERALARAGWVAVEIASFSASRNSPVAETRERIASADLYVGVIGFRYGSPVQQDPTRSYTELEFDAASELGVPRLVFLVSTNSIARPSFVEGDSERQQAFRRRIRESSIVTTTISEPIDLEQRLYQALTELDANSGRRSRDRIFVVPPLTGTEVSRPELINALLTAVRLPAARAVGIMGAGGFGKSTLARMLAHEPAVRDHFGVIVWVTVGSESQGNSLAEQANEVVELLTGQRPHLTDPVASGARLAAVLDDLGDRHVLLVLDDVWAEAQLEPFTGGGRSGDVVRLVTSRRPGVLPTGTAVIHVDRLTPTEAAELLMKDLPGDVPTEMVTEATEIADRWPVLLSLMNSAVRADVAAGSTVERALADVVSEIRDNGAGALDNGDPTNRVAAIGSTIGVSLSRLAANEQTRFTELSVFPEDTHIPRDVLERYWGWTGGWTKFRVRRFCQHLSDLALAEYHLNPPRLSLHDLIRGWLRSETATQTQEMSAALVNSLRQMVPLSGRVSAWWELPLEDVFLWSWIATFLREAGFDEELRSLLHESAFLIGKLQATDPAALAADLALLDDPVTVRLQRVISLNASAFASRPRADAPAETLHALLRDIDELRVISDELETRFGPFPTAIETTHDVFNLRLELVGHLGAVTSMAVSPDASWLASTSDDGTIRIWDPATGAARHILTGHTRGLRTPAVAPDGSWLASTGDDGTIRIWDPATGNSRLVSTGHGSTVQALAIAPDGSWLASAGDDGSIRIWDPTTGEALSTLTGHASKVRALAIAPDGSWLASKGDDGTIRIWDPATGTARHVLTGHGSTVQALAIAPDGNWLASTGEAGTIRIWDPTTGEALSTLIGHASKVQALAIAPDGSWLASTSDDGTIRIWDPITGNALSTLVDASKVQALAIAPDGSWLASTSDDGTIRVWDPIISSLRFSVKGHAGSIDALAVSPSGSWMASGGMDQVVRVWDVSMI